MKHLTTVLLMLLALGTSTVHAAPAWQRGGEWRPASERASGISLDRAADQVRRQTGGRILSAETVDKNGQQVHRIKVLTPDHKVVIREIPAGGR